MAWTKAKTAVVVGVGILLTAGTATVAIKEIAPPTPTAVVATGKISKQSCVFAGYATPEATFQTMLWAAARHDTNALWSCFDPASKAIIERQRNGLKGQLLLFDILTAFQVMSKEATSPDVTTLTINVEAGARGSDTLIVTMIHREDGWKYSHCHPISGHF